MRVYKFLIAAAFVTFFSLLYVYQQTEIFRFGYAGQKKLVLFQDLLDNNTILRYNIERNASLVRIANRISDNGAFQMPDSYRLVKLTLTPGNSKAAIARYKKESLVVQLFGIKRQAEAKTLNP